MIAEYLSWTFCFKKNYFLPISYGCVDCDDRAFLVRGGCLDRSFMHSSYCINSLVVLSDMNILDICEHCSLNLLLCWWQQVTMLCWTPLVVMGRQSVLFEFLSSILHSFSRWMKLLQDIKQCRTTFDTSETRRHFGPVVVDYAKVQSKVSLKYDSWHKDVLSKFGQLLGQEMTEFHAQVRTLFPWLNISCEQWWSLWLFLALKRYQLI